MGGNSLSGSWKRGATGGVGGKLDEESVALQVMPWLAGAHMSIRSYNRQCSRYGEEYYRLELENVER